MFASKVLKPYNGYMIEKSWETHSITGKIKKDTIIYTAYTEDGEGLVDADTTLPGLKKKLREEEW